MARQQSSGTNRKGLSARVPKYKNSTPKQLKIQKHKTSKRPFRGSPIGSLEARRSSEDEEGNTLENVSDDSDAERFARMSALMAMLGDEINDYGSAIHSEIQRQMEENKFHDATNSISQHLDTLKWSTPPNSPGSTNSSARTPSSVSSETKQNLFIERDLRNKEFYSLLEGDHEFHKLMRDLTGLREWWGMNHTEWRRRRDAILGIEETLKALALQMEQLGGLEHQRLQLQFKLQMDEMTSELDWFPKNERLQKKVKAQFKSIAKKTAKLEGQVSPLKVVREWRGVNGFGFRAEPEWTDITDAPWWYEHGFKWWLSNIGADHLQYCLEKFKSQLGTSRSRFEDLETTIVMTKSEIVVIERDGPVSDETRERNIAEFRGMIQSWLEPGDVDTTYWDDELEAKIVKRNGAVAAREHQLSEKKDLLVVLNDEKYRLEFEILDLQRRQERDTAILALVKTIVNIPLLDDLSSLFAEQLYFVLAFQHKYEQIRNILSRVQQSTEFFRSDRMKLLGMLQDHYEFHGSHHQEFIFTAQQTMHHIETSESFGTDWADILHFDMKEQLESILGIDRQSGEFKDRRKGNSNSQSAIDLGKGAAIDIPFDRVPLDLEWGQITMIEEALEALDNGIVVMGGEIQHTITALRSFFVSPDVAPTFEHISNISKPDFLMLVNSFLEDELGPREIEAFLLYCHQVGDLFTLTMTDKISAYTQGWEVVVEMPIAGPVRRVRLIKPQGVDSLEAWLASSQISIRDQHLRLSSEHKFISYVRKSHPPAAQVDQEVIKGYLAYFHQAGRFYKYSSEVNESGVPILIRIDNGWNIDTSGRYSPLFKTPLPWFKDLREIALRRDVQELIGNEPIMDESRMFKLLMPFFETGLRGFFGWRKVIVTKHRFHLFLRWCDQKGEVLRLSRDGSIIRFLV